MLKKAATVLLAAAMSLTMLTACGGGSGSGVGGGIPVSGSYTMETTKVENANGPVTQNNRHYVTTNGTWYYSEYVNGTSASASLSKADGEHYVINPTNNKAWKAESSSAGGEDGNEEVDEKVTATKTSGTWKYKEKTYTTQEVTYTAASFTQTVKYCYDGATLAYIETTGKDEGGRYYSLEKVTKYEKAANESKLNPNNYKLVENPQDLF